MFSPTQPAKFLQCVSNTPVGSATWPFDDGTGEDLWFIAGRPYQWDIELTVTAQTHSSHLTREPFAYNGLDINLGDYVTGTTSGIAVKIISITSKTETLVSCVVQDVDRFNTFHDSTASGNGIFSAGTTFVFELGDDGLPILLPLPGAGVLSANFGDDLQSRFRINNPNNRFRFVQTAHGFVEGDEIVMNPSTELFEKASVSNLDIVGRVVDVNSGPDTFLLDPVTKIREDILPPLPGTIGDTIYIDLANPGELTAVFPTGGAKAVFLQLTDAIAATILGTVPDPTTAKNNILEINGVEVDFVTDPNVDLTSELADMITDINALEPLHGVTASPVTSPTVATGIVNGPFNDINAGAVTFTINGTPVSLVTDIGGFGFPLIDDMIADINALTGSHGVVATDSSGFLVLTEPSGGAITLVDVSPPAPPPATGTRKEFTVSTGLSSVGASSTSQLLLVADDGRQILLRNVTGDPLGDIGLYSVENGRVPFGLVIEQSIKATESFVVADIAERDALTIKTGDTVFVIDKDDGEWGNFIFDGSDFVIISTEESARTDSRSLSVDIDFNSASTVSIGEVSSGVRVSPVSIEVLTAFDGAPVISVGDVGDVSRLFENGSVDLLTPNAPETFVSTPVFQYTGGSDTEIFVSFAPNGATQGTARVTITYS